jgi:hypothetical protein
LLGCGCRGRGRGNAVFVRVRDGGVVVCEEGEEEGCWAGGEVVYVAEGERAEDKGEE